MDRAALEKPFPTDVIKSRKGPFGELSYVEGATYIRRLNEAFNSSWSWRIVSHEVRDSDVVVHGVLVAGGEEKHAFGGSAITTSRQTGEVMALGDDLKAAATDALKKACSLFGIGLDLYAASAEKGAAPTAQAPATRPLRSVPPEPTNGAPVEKENGVAAPRLTLKQLKAIYAVGHANGLGEAELTKQSVDAYGVAPQYLTKADASAFITSLSGR